MLDEFDENQDVVLNVVEIIERHPASNSTTATDATAMPNVSSGKTNKPTKTKKLKPNFRIWTSY